MSKRLARERFLFTGAVETDESGNYLKLAEYINLDYAIRTDDPKYKKIAELWVRVCKYRYLDKKKSTKSNAGRFHMHIPSYKSIFQVCGALTKVMYFFI